MSKPWLLKVGIWDDWGCSRQEPDTRTTLPCRGRDALAASAESAWSPSRGVVGWIKSEFFSGSLLQTWTREGSVFGREELLRRSEDHLGMFSCLVLAPLGLAILLTVFCWNESDCIDFKFGSWTECTAQLKPLSTLVADRPLGWLLSRPLTSLINNINSVSTPFRASAATVWKFSRKSLRRSSVCTVIASCGKHQVAQKNVAAVSMLASVLHFLIRNVPDTERFCMVAIISIHNGKW